MLEEKASLGGGMYCFPSLPIFSLLSITLLGKFQP